MGNNSQKLKIKETMLIDNSRGRLDEIKSFAKENGLYDHFEEVLNNLQRWEKAGWFKNGDELKTTVYSDFAPLSLYFVRTVNGNFDGNGGVIFHGKHDRGGDGGAPTFSVCIEPDSHSHWSIHT
jgi:hypothetical protein